MAPGMAAEADSRTITRVTLRNYKSITACDVELAPLTILVGANGAGQSNFLDALRFTAQALRFSLDHAFRERGGINEVRRRSRGHPNHFGVRLDFRLPETVGWYVFEVGARPKSRYIVRKEVCVVSSAERGRSGSFRVENGRTVASTLWLHSRYAGARAIIRRAVRFFTRLPFETPTHTAQGNHPAGRYANRTRKCKPPRPTTPT